MSKTFAPEKDLQHFLKLALAQLRHKLNQRKDEGYSEEARKMLLLEALIKEQVPTK
ncbi:MAG TPA: hypothetical protein VM432_12940 [Bdellovibrionales bacterium]|nr:hypothetical protein [Bdellovibrionales bacterium]